MKNKLKKITVLVMAVLAVSVTSTYAFADSSCADPWSFMNPKCFKAR